MHRHVVLQPVFHFWLVVVLVKLPYIRIYIKLLTEMLLNGGLFSRRTWFSLSEKCHLVIIIEYDRTVWKQQRHFWAHIRYMFIFSFLDFKIASILIRSFGEDFGKTWISMVYMQLSVFVNLRVFQVQAW